MSPLTAFAPEIDGTSLPTGQAAAALCRALIGVRRTLAYTCDTELRYLTVANPGGGFRAEEVIGRRDEELLPPGDAAPLTAFKRAALARREPSRGEVTMRVQGVLRTYEICAVPLFAPDGRVTGLAVAAADLTDPQAAEAERRAALDGMIQRAAERRLRLMVNELNHRMKNTLATIQAIASQTLRSAPSPEEFRRGFEGRLQALSLAHDRLTADGWAAADLGETLASALSPFRDGQAGTVSLAGPPVRVGARAAVTLAMVAHELATNATKYGALSVPGGRVAVDWSVADGRLTLHWQERDGPPVTPPERRGFGSRLIAASVAGDLDGESVFTWEPTGLVLRLVVPVAGLYAPQDGDPGGPA